MEKKLYDNCVEILKEELIAAMGCTEPIAIAFVSALARKTLGSEPVSCEVLCSGNIVKNVMGVVVPNSQGQRGIAVAAGSSLPRAFAPANWPRALRTSLWRCISRMRRAILSRRRSRITTIM